MKAFIASLAIALMFAVGPAFAGSSDSGDEYGSGCSKDKWSDT